MDRAGSPTVGYSIGRHNVDYGLSLTSATVLARLNEAGPQRVTDLAALELVAQPTMTAIAGRLEARGFVERKRDAADKRVVTVALTPPAGRSSRSCAPAAPTSSPAT